MTTPSFEPLEHQVERLVREHIAACHRAVTAAVERAFAIERALAVERALGCSTTPPSKSRSAPRSASRARPPAELTALSERLYEAVCANPGVGMAALAAHLGTASGELRRPMALLKAAGRVRSAGQRQFTRYFPRVAKTSAAA
jgi:hypothetical protein